jgi:hypothetical protein
LAAITILTLLSGTRKTCRPSPNHGLPKSHPPPSIAESPAPVPAPAVSRSRGQTEWAFFFRPGDTLSRMADGSLLGVVARLEPRHRFPDGSTGPAYVVRSPDQQEGAFDADELERRARIEAIRDVRIPPGQPPAAPTTR